MDAKGLHAVFADQLKDLYNAESQLVKALPKLRDSADNSDLKDAISRHLEQTKHQIIRLEQIFERLDEKPTGQECFAMKGLIQEAYDVGRKHYAPPALDAALIAVLQRIEHYEVAGYGTARSFAKHLGDEESANLLQQTLSEEAQADRVLSELAENEINSRAIETGAAAG